MGSIADPGEVTQASAPPAPPPTSFDEFQRQTSLMTSCTLLWKELSDHFTSLEQDLLRKSEALKAKLQTLDTQTKQSLEVLEKRETSIAASISITLKKVDESKRAALVEFGNAGGSEEPEVDNSAGLLLKLRSFCVQMDSRSFWSFVIVRKKELESLRSEIRKALGDCVDPPKFVMEAISEVFPVDKRELKSERSNDLGWACVLLLESLIPVMMDPVLGSERMLVTPAMRERANEIAETWKKSLDERGGIENVKTPDVHTFLQHLVTFGVVKEEDVDLYRKLVVGSAWRKHMPKLALSLGLGDKMPELIEELISRGQQVDAVHFTYEVGLINKFPPVPLLKAFLKDAKKAATAILEDPNNSGRAAHLAAKKELSAIRAVLKCIEEYKLEAEFPPEHLKKRLDQLEKTKSEKKKPAAAAAPAAKRTRVSNGGPMPPAKAGRSTNAYVSSFPAAAPTFVRSPSHTQYPTGLPAYPASPIYTHGSMSPQYVYSPEAAPYPGSPYSPYGSYGNAMAPAYQQAYY
ncbi:PREDICTED: FRIGIDA-like protein 4a [Ipomoea nil]|uniref:FRIGIDA-like protein 4a n=1 Tax=Ipomoea nil TaxID=35883 RepID=UPI000901D129|nr:PREDICTED: FRIGIDA-like protein 4a [Ipomoea nil]XP_019180377.1 PREDICTED: FRIGIDA-like protein 4a [Ipomoea nil]